MRALILELDRKGAESEAQRQMLETVFDSMNDGVVIVDGSEVTMYNSAARQLLGRPIPTGVAESWSEPSASPPPTETRSTTRPCARPVRRGDPAAHAACEVTSAPTAPRRIIDISAQPLGNADERSTMVLLHDVTAQRARLRELTNFAGMVAHDLRGPLTVLDGWLEVVEDGDEIGDELVLEDAVAKAREASKRMRQVIEDWLNYTVVQNGQLRPDAVKLDEVVTEIVESRRAAAGPTATSPGSVLDLDPQRAGRPGAAAPAARQPRGQRDQVHRCRPGPVGRDLLRSRRRAGLDPRRASSTAGSASPKARRS